MPHQYQLRALVWDMGGVLVRNMDHSIRGRLAEPFGMTYLDLENLFFGNEVALNASLGLATEADSWEFVRKKLKLRPEEMPAFIKTFWSCDRLDENLYAFSMALKPRYKIGLLSNAYPETRSSNDRRFQHFHELFDVTIYSSEVGMAKPDPRIYRLMLEKLGVEPGEAIFVDDFIENVEGARAVGMKAIHFKDAEQVQTELMEMLA